MMQPPLDTGITLTKPSQWVWHVWFDHKRVGTVFGDSSCGFIAVGNDSKSIGHGYLSADAAMQACVPVMSTVASLQPAGGRASSGTA